MQITIVFTLFFFQFLHLNLQIFAIFSQKMLILTIFSQKSTILDNFPLQKVKRGGNYFTIFSLTGEKKSICLAEYSPLEHYIKVWLENVMLLLKRVMQQKYTIFSDNTLILLWPLYVTNKQSIEYENCNLTIDHCLIYANIQTIKLRIQVCF